MAAQLDLGGKVSQRAGAYQRSPQAGERALVFVWETVIQVFADHKVQYRISEDIRGVRCPQGDSRDFR